MSRQSNAVHMTGKEHPAAEKYPWHEMQPGDWFVPRSPAATVASKQNSRGDAVYAAVNSEGRNIVVRIK